MDGVSINLGGAGQQNRKSVGRNVGGRLFDIIDLIVMRVVDTGEINALAIPGERFALIEQYGLRAHLGKSVYGVLGESRHDSHGPRSRGHGNSHVHASPRSAPSAAAGRDRSR